MKKLLLAVLTVSTIAFAKDVVLYDEVFSGDAKEYKVTHGKAHSTDAGLVIETNSWVHIKTNSGYTLKNGTIELALITPKVDKSKIPVYMQRTECFCAFKIHLGRFVVDVNDMGVIFEILDIKEKGVEKVLATQKMDMVPDGSEMEIGVLINDGWAKCSINGMTVLEGPAQFYDFSDISIETYGHSFTILELKAIASPRPALVIDTNSGTVELGAVYHASHFNKGMGLKNHHFAVWEGGKAADEALFTTYAPDSAIHDALEKIGLRPGNNLTQESWDKRKSKKSTEPDKHAEGSKISVDIVFAGKSYPVEKIISDTHGNPFEFRFAGNRALIPKWLSGCVICLQSCPGGKIGNSTYTIRDLVKEIPQFIITDAVPFQDQQEVTLRFRGVGE